MQNYQILVCEDEVEIGNAIEIYLKNQGYGVHRAYNGKEGLEVLARQTIHLAIVDLMMPVKMCIRDRFRSMLTTDSRCWLIQRKALRKKSGSGA